VEILKKYKNLLVLTWQHHMGRRWRRIWDAGQGNCRGLRSIRIRWWGMGRCVWGRACRGRIKCLLRVC